jgi:hypothetical protein
VGDERKNVEANRARFFKAIGINESDVAFTRQVHGDKVLHADRAGSFENCDALVTNERNRFLAISVADCVPIVLYDPVTRSIAAVHSGWRGSEAKIVLKAIQSMQRLFHAKPENMIAFLGPAAGSCCYEVGEEVAGKFDPRYATQSSNNKTHLNLKRYNKDLLTRAGIEEYNIEISPACTICNEDYHSHRRDRERSGRMLAVIGVRKSQ